VQRSRIRRLFYSAYNRLERGFGRLPSVYREDLEFLDDLDWDFDESDVQRWLKKFELVLADMEIWLNEIFPRDPTLEDRKALARYEKAIEVAGEKLEKIKKLIA